MARQITRDDETRNRLLKLIPSEIIAAHTLIRGFLPSTLPRREMGLWLLGSVAVLLVLTPVVLTQVYRVESRSQVIASMVSYGVWVVSIGDGVSQLWSGYEPFMGSIVFVLWGVLLAAFSDRFTAPPPSNDPADQGDRP